MSWFGTMRYVCGGVTVSSRTFCILLAGGLYYGTSSDLISRRARGSIVSALDLEGLRQAVSNLPENAPQILHRPQLPVFICSLFFFFFSPSPHEGFELLQRYCSHSPDFLQSPFCYACVLFHLLDHPSRFVPSSLVASSFFHSFTSYFYNTNYSK